MVRQQKGNDASRFRDIRRRCRKKAHASDIEDLLKGISDPYFRSQSHILIAQLNGDPSRIERALLSADRVDALWRRAELFGELLKLSNDLSGDLKEMVKRGIFTRIMEMDTGKGLSDAISTCSRRLDAGVLPDLLKRALSNKGFRQNDAKSVLKAWSRNLPSSVKLLTDLEVHLDSIKDVELRSQLLGYTHLQLERSRIKDIPKGPFEKALRSAFDLKGEKRLESISYLISSAGSRWSLEMVRDMSQKDTSIMERIKIISYLASASDKAGYKDLAEELIKEAVKMTEDLKSKGKRSGLLLHLAKNLLRMQRKEDALALMERIIAETEEGDPTRSFVVLALKKEGVKIPEEWEVDAPGPAPSKPEKTDGPRDVLALYDTYEGAIKEIHLRAIARAAPLCFGFDLDLALIGFPEKDLDALIEKTAKETNIGKGGRYLRELHKQGRIQLLEASDGEPPGDWKDLGYPVATTSRPDKDMTVEIGTARERSEDGRVCLVMGLGKQGLPRNFLRTVNAHLELTGKGVPLETATAMGVMAYSLYVLKKDRS